MLRLRFFDGLTLAQCGEKLNRSRERVRQIEAKALRKLRHPSRCKILLPYLYPEYTPKQKIALNEPVREVFAYRPPYQISEEVWGRKGPGFELSIHKYGGYVLRLTTGQKVSYIDGKNLRLCKIRDATKYKTLEGAVSAARVLLTHAAHITQDTVLIPESVTKPYDHYQ